MSNTTGAQLQRGVIVEFDFAVLPGHRLLLDCCAARLAQEGVKLDASLMARYLSGRSFSSGLNTLCSKQQKTVDLPVVIADCQAQFAAALTGALAEIPAGFVAFVSALLAKGTKVVLVSRADADAIRAHFPDANEKLVVLHESTTCFGFTNWDGWRRVARKNDLHDRLCVAVAGSGLSVKGALTSGFGVLAKPNPLTAYQDVGGCDVCVDAYAADLANAVFRILRV